MPFSGGTYTFPSLSGSFNPAIDGQQATAANWNTLATDLQANGLSMCITKNGGTTLTANIPMAGFVFTGLGAGASNGQSVRYEQTVPLLTARSYLAGCTLSRTSNTVLAVAAGTATDSTNVFAMPVTAGSIDCATTGANGLDAGSLGASTWYHAFAIAKTDYTVALLASTSATAPTMPAGYTLKRRLGSFCTDGSSHILAFTQDGDLFQWTAPVTSNVSANNPGTSAVTATLSAVPTGVNVIANVNLQVTNNDTNFVNATYAKMSDLATTDTAASTSWTDISVTGNVAAAVNVGAARVSVRTNTSAQVRYRVSFSSADVQVVISVIGWTDSRGRNA